LLWAFFLNTQPCNGFGASNNDLRKERKDKEIKESKKNAINDKL